MLELGESVNLREYTALYAKVRGQWPVIHEDEHASVRRELSGVLRRAQTELPGYTFVGLADVFVTGQGERRPVKWLDGRDFLYADDDHLSEAGFERVAPPHRRSALPDSRDAGPLRTRTDRARA